MVKMLLGHLYMQYTMFKSLAYFMKHLCYFIQGIEDVVVFLLTYFPFFKL